MPDGLYPNDLLAWSEQQAARLRRVAAGERVNDVDWENIIEEIESLGSSELRAAQSFLRLAILHAMKVIAWPGHPARRHWEDEITNFLIQAEDRFQPGMRQNLDVGLVHRKALKQFRQLRMEEPPAMGFGDAPVVTADDLLDEEFSADALLARLRASAMLPTRG